VISRRFIIGRSLEEKRFDQMERNTLRASRNIAQRCVPDKLAAADAYDEDDSDYNADLQALFETV